mgnify:CR=1 FL=1
MKPSTFVALVGTVLTGVLLAPQAHGDPTTVCYHGDVARGTPGDGAQDWWLCMGDQTRLDPGTWQHIVPFIDPNSADGFGGMQLMPPTCVRFPQNYPSCGGFIYEFPTDY